MHASVSTGGLAIWLAVGALALPANAADVPVNAPYEPGVISTSAAEVRLAISPDGRQMLWGSIGREVAAATA
ncbi:hypothetical protein [Pinirhizobacter soli]|uniref:hypothetical protein n=1 Tax=Pinirhizobacter soli TaxID=2786953 RepID=UPI00202A23E3|nr:hypothetical protein [Pinirhizobacter soli]